MNVDIPHLYENVSGIFQALSQPARLRILGALRGGDACVCHLEAGLGYRQAYLSQQLTVLREAGLLVSRREGKHIYYGLADPRVVDLIQAAGSLAGGMEDWLPALTGVTLAGCVCPHCQLHSEDIEKTTL